MEVIRHEINLIHQIHPFPHHILYYTYIYIVYYNSVIIEIYRVQEQRERNP